MVVTTNSYCKSVITNETIFHSLNYYNIIVKSTIIILNYIFLVDIAIQNICPLRKIKSIVKNTIYFTIEYTGASCHNGSIKRKIY